MRPTAPIFFATPADLRAWLGENHRSADELWVGLYKKGSGSPSITWPELVDEALCVGWIDGIRNRIDEHRYQIRITPRRPRSTWSRVNLKRVPELIAAGRMRPAGLRAYEARVADRSGIYSSEQRPEPELDAAAQRHFQAEESAWSFFESLPPSYRKAAIGWVVSAKKEETRQRRLSALIAASREGRIVDAMGRARNRPSGGQLTP